MFPELTQAQCEEVAAAVKELALKDWAVVTA
jgi:hypothetical protein